MNTRAARLSVRNASNRQGDKTRTQSRYRNSPTPFGANSRFFSTSVKCATDKRTGTALGYANRRNHHGEPSKRITRKRRIRASIKR